MSARFFHTKRGNACLIKRQENRGTLAPLELTSEPSFFKTWGARATNMVAWEKPRGDTPRDLRMYVGVYALPVDEKISLKNLVRGSVILSHVCDTVRFPLVLSFGQTTAGSFTFFESE